MTVSTPKQPDAGADLATTYKASIDAAIAAAWRTALAFAPHEQSTPDMTVRLDAGAIYVDTALTEVAAQSTGTIVAPTTNPRIDRVVIDASTGVVSVITGAEGASPVAPAITTGNIPICQVLLDDTPATTAIANSLITDERPINMVSGSGSGSGGALLNYVSGLITSNDTDASHDINVTAGICRDSSDTIDITLAAEITKQIDASWATGDDAGGLSSSLTVANTTWYHIFAVLIGGSADVLFDTSITCANGVTDHSVTAYRRIGSVLTDGSANIIKYFQHGDHFIWDVPTLELSGAGSTTRVTLTLTTPLGVVCKSIFSCHGQQARGGDFVVLFLSPEQTDQAPSSSAAPGNTIYSGGAANSHAGGQAEILTDTNSAITYRCFGTQSMWVYCSGWKDFRGKS